MSKSDVCNFSTPDIKEHPKKSKGKFVNLENVNEVLFLQTSSKIIIVMIIDKSI